jgi:hypothetical protein
MATLEPGETLAVLLQRLEALEQKLDGQTPSAARGGATLRPPGPPPTATRQTAGAAGVADRGAQRPGERPAYGAPAATPTRPAYAPAAGSRPPSASSTVRPSPSPAAAPAPAAAPPAPATATATLDPTAVELDDRLTERWQSVIAAVNGRKRMLGAFLVEGRFLGVSARGVELAMDDLHRAVVDDAENRTLIANELAQAFGRPLKLCCVPLTPDLAAERPGKRDLAPIIDRTIAWFEGDIVERPARGPNGRERNGG